jgi:predicted glycosyltransferase
MRPKHGKTIGGIATLPNKRTHKILKISTQSQLIFKPEHIRTNDKLTQKFAECLIKPAFCKKQTLGIQNHL